MVFLVSRLSIALVTPRRQPALDHHVEQEPGKLSVVGHLLCGAGVGKLRVEVFLRHGPVWLDYPLAVSQLHVIDGLSTVPGMAAPDMNHDVLAQQSHTTEATLCELEDSLFGSVGHRIIKTAISACHCGPQILHEYL